MAGNSIFGAYDVRGIYPSEINEDEAYRIAQAFVEAVKPKSVVLARDVRESGPSLMAAVRDGFRDRGVDVLNIGMVPTDVFYYAVGALDVDGGISITGSHNPAQWNGMKFSARGSLPISADYLLPEIERAAHSHVLGRRFRAGMGGREETKDVMPEYLAFLRAFIRSEIRPFKVAADGNSGQQPAVFRALIEACGLAVEFVAVNDVPDGNFPKGPPNPLLPERRREIIDLVKKERADFGVAWDGDGDRCFFVDERGVFHEGYFTTAVLAQEMLAQYPGQKILSDPRLTWAVTDAVKAAGGVPLVVPSGGSRMAKRLRDEGAPFGGELSGHYYFREFFYRDSGLVPVLVMLQMLSRSRPPLSSYYEKWESAYAVSGELNYGIADQRSLINAAEKRYHDGNTSFIDGLSVEYPEWRFNLRSSHTEPLIRLNIEARAPEAVREKQRELEELIFAHGGTKK